MTSETQMITWAKELFPIPRSLTGEGLRRTLRYFKAINPEFEFKSFETGRQVFDWIVPKEWKICDAWIEHESGERFCEFSKHNLHIMGYSTPIDKVMSLEELSPHIYTQDDLPDAIPYVTSYYKERWGFCMSANDKMQLPQGNYRVFIDSELFDGQLDIAEAKLKGQQDKELLFTSYVCHPSMANNELSGPVVLNALLKYVKATYPTPKMSYRFLLVPETIGSISYLSENLDDLKNNLECGFVLSCVGDERAYSHILSRKGNSLADKALEAALLGKDSVNTYSFLKRGSDERQYCAPGIDLPVCGFCRSKYAEFIEYHTSEDDFDLVTQKGLEGAFNVMRSIIDAFELGLYPENTVLGEPQLGKRGLYPTLSKKDQYAGIRTRMDFLAYADGKTDVFDIAKTLEKNLEDVLNEYVLLSENGIIKRSK